MIATLDYPTLPFSKEKKIRSVRRTRRSLLETNGGWNLNSRQEKKRGERHIVCGQKERKRERKTRAKRRWWETTQMLYARGIPKKYMWRRKKKRGEKTLPFWVVSAWKRSRKWERAITRNRDFGGNKLKARRENWQLITPHMRPTQDISVFKQGLTMRLTRGDNAAGLSDMAAWHARPV